MSATEQNTNTTTTQPIIFYDIASSTPHHTFAPNPWKTRYALNHKNLPYKTKPIDMPDIHSVRSQLGVPANRTLPNGSPYHTLPLIHDQSTATYIGDTFEIALHLDKTYPDSPPLFRPGTIGLTAALTFSALLLRGFARGVAGIALGFLLEHQDRRTLGFFGQGACRTFFCFLFGLQRALGLTRGFFRQPGGLSLLGGFTFR